MSYFELHRTRVKSQTVKGAHEEKTRATMAATAAQAAPNGQAGALDELATSDEVKEYCHEGEGENTEHLNSMDLHDIKTELEKDAEAEEVSPFIPLEHATTIYTCGIV